MPRVDFPPVAGRYQDDVRRVYARSPNKLREIHIEADVGRQVSVRRSVNRDALRASLQELRFDARDGARLQKFANFPAIRSDQDNLVLQGPARAGVVSEIGRGNIDMLVPGD